MPKNRPAIPLDVQRAIFVESGHRCACCGVAFPLERAHIVPWSKSKDHSKENLLCLCANCHETADRDWDRKTFFAYKANPWVNRQATQGGNYPDKGGSGTKRVAEVLFRLIATVCVLGLSAYLISYLAPTLFSKKTPKLEDWLSRLEVRHPGQEKSISLLREWSKRHPDHFNKRGCPTHIGFADIWSQTFSSGRVLYNSTSNWLVVMFGVTSSYHRYTKPGASITTGPGNREVNEELLSDLLSRIDEPEEREAYRDLVDRRKLMGGIGTIYIREDLRAKIGAPLASEFSRPDALVVVGPNYEMIVSLRNDKKSTEENDIYILWTDESRFEKHSLFSWRWTPRDAAWDPAGGYPAKEISGPMDRTEHNQRLHSTAQARPVSRSRYTT